MTGYSWDTLKRIEKIVGQDAFEQKKDNPD